MRGGWLASSILLAILACSSPRRADPVSAPAATSDDDALVAQLKGSSLLAWRGRQQLVGYRNTEQLAAAGVVRRGPAVLPLPNVAIDLSAFTYSHQGATRTIDDFMASVNVVGLLVLVDGGVALERYAHGNTSATTWTSFSVAKSVTSLLFGAAIQDGHIKSLDERITTYIPELAGTAYDPVTIRHLLQMSSGIEWSDDPMVDMTRMSQLYREGGFTAHLNHLATRRRAAPPGSVFRYVTAEADLAGAVLRAATGRDLSTYLTERIWRPFGMEADGYWLRIPHGELEFGQCCLAATLRDYGRIGLFAAAGGVTRDGKRLLPESWIAESTRPSAASKDYGYYWWLRDNGRYFASGLFGQHIEVAPTERIVVAIQSYWPEPVSDELVQHNDAFVDALVTAAARHTSPAR